MSSEATDTPAETTESTQPEAAASASAPSPTQPEKSKSPPRSSRGRQASSSGGSTQRSRSLSASRRSRSKSSGRTRRNFMGSDDEDLQAEIERYQRSPGPVYETGTIKDKMVFRHSFAANFGTEPRDKHSTLPNLTPGPTYFPNTDVTSAHTKSPRATIGRAPRSMSVGRTAAAPDANIVLPPLETITRHTFHASFGTAKRNSDKKETAPGPGAYSTTSISKPTSTKGTFSYSKRGSGAWIFA